MHSYLSGRGSNIDNIDSEKAGDSFSSYLADPSKQHLQFHCLRRLKVRQMLKLM